MRALIAPDSWELTGEGLSDAQALHGKLPYMVAKKTRSYGVRVALISGDVVESELLQGDFDVALTTREPSVSLSKTMQDAAYYVSQAATKWARCVIVNESDVNE